MSKYAVCHRKMQHYSAYRVSLYKQQRHAIKAYFTYCSFLKMAQRDTGVKFGGKICYGVEGWRTITNSSGRR